jgi:DNA-binding transcriptional regulator YdaS (Cro superfamily)
MDNTSSEDNDNRLNWRKSVRSVAAGNCTEVASATGFIVVRDSMDPEITVLRYPASAWASFLGAARAGRFDVVG